MKHDIDLHVLSGTGLSKSFGKGAKAVQILQGLDISLPRGALSLVKGPSGCGKSTLLAILAGLTAPDAGRVDALGQDLWSLRPPARDAFRLRHMGFVFQGSILFPALRAHEQIELVLNYMGIAPKAARDRAMTALEDVGLGPRADLRPDALSGGEKQRVAIACALAKAPEIIFADEPTSALDTENSDLVSRHLRRLASDHGVTVICVTHDDRLSPWADRIYHMRAGRIDRIQTEVT
ncbi:MULTISPECIES: ABC transporter ATP-binding protein [unclassified Yoonia]|uniref:ABC transporter ATP-binding protein n=1 Tax=unclassified Yoonia TaxID=2629118 RepID=UPI002AFE1A82|nr:MULTISPECIES: ABC transporter ATP-binding protein [unclassified Yoonia]